MEKLKQTENPYVIVVGIDFEPNSELALAGALALASDRDAAAVHLVYSDSAQAFANDPRGGETRGNEMLERLEAAARTAHQNLTAIVGRPVETISLHSHYRVGRPSVEVVQLAVDLDADLVVVGTHGRKGLTRFVVGSVASSILADARCPVFVVRPKDHENLGEVPEIEPPPPGGVENSAPSAKVRRSRVISYRDTSLTASTKWGASS